MKLSNAEMLSSELPDLLSRRAVLRGLGAAGLVGVPTRAQRPRQPNIVWIIAEDISPDLGCYGDSYAVTPQADRLATQGARYTNAFSVSGVCAPSRSALATGAYPTSIGTMHMRTRVVPPPNVKCFTEALRAAGYYCCNNGKTDYQFEAPFTAWDHDAPEAHWRNRPDPDQPFFAVFNHRVCHESQIRVSEEQRKLNTARLSQEQFHDPGQAKLPPYYPDTPLSRLDWARYHDNVTAFDYHAGDLLRQLEEDGLGDNTAVFLFGDHGRGLPRAKRWIYDSGIHVPLIVCWPGVIEPGTVENRMVSFVDFAPTVLSMAGVAIPSEVQGLPFLGEAAAEPRQYVFAARDRMDETYDRIRAVRDQRYKYLRNYQPDKPYSQHIGYMDQMPTMREWRRLHAEGKLVGPQRLFFQAKPVEELYDTASDPHEVRNLAQDPQHSDILGRLRGQLREWTSRFGDRGEEPEFAMMREMRPDGNYARTQPVHIELFKESTSSSTRHVRLSCPTEGASIGYTTEAGPAAHWALYSRPLEFSGPVTLRAKAIRYGYEESDETWQELA